MNLKQKKLLNYVLVGVMAAMIFVTTYFLKIPITTPAGPTMIKVSNILIQQQIVIYNQKILYT